MPKEAARLRQPVRLLRRRGQWSVEFTRLVAVDDQLMRPEYCRLAATPDVLRTLSPSCPPERLREAEAILLAPDDGSERSFELAEEGWAPLGQPAPSQRPLTRGEMMSLIGDLQTQLTLMRGLHDALLTRLVSVEAAMQPKPASDLRPGPRPVRKVPSRRDMLAVLQRDAPPRPADGSGPLALDGVRDATEPPAAPSNTPAAPAADTPPAAAAEAAPARAPAFRPTMPPPAHGRLMLPSAGDVIQCLRVLAADVEVSPDTSALPSTLSDFYVARLLDATKATVGAVFINQRAAATLGGGLLGLPNAARDEQARRGLANATLEGVNEICNNLCGLLNRTNPQCFTKLVPLEHASAAVAAVLAEPASVLALSTPSNGAVFIVSR